MLYKIVKYDTKFKNINYKCFRIDNLLFLILVSDNVDLFKNLKYMILKKKKEMISL